MAIVDSRYARAFASVVEAQKLDGKAAEAQLKDFIVALESSDELREVMEDPSIPQEQKVRLLDGIAAKLGMFPAVRNFVAVIIDHGRLQEIGTMLSAFASLEDASGGIAEAEIVSAHKLDEGSRSLLEQQVAKLAGGQTVHATYSEDASLLGGAVVRLGSTVYDGSVRAQLQQLKQRLIAATA